MFSFVNPFEARLFRIILIALLAGVVCCAMLPGPVIAKDGRTPYIVPGDGDGVGGCKGFDLQDQPLRNEDDSVAQLIVEGPDESRAVIRFYKWELSFRFFLIIRK